MDILNIITANGIQIIKWGVKAIFITFAILATFSIITFAMSMIGILANNSALGDITAMIQVWAPFNIAPIYAWVVTASSLYFAWRFSVMIVNWVQTFLGQS